MVVREQTAGAGGYLCIPQSQHAALAGQIARAWGNPEFPAPSPRESVCLAAERHDDGMDPFDDAPEIDPETGLPRDFMHMPLERWIDCWRRGPREVGEADCYAGLLVSMHGLHLLGYRRGADRSEKAKRLIASFEEEQRSLQSRLRAEAAAIEACEPHLDAAALETNRKLIEVWDALSLALCMPRLPERFEGVPMEEHATTMRVGEVGSRGSGPVLVEVDPWPFSSEDVPLAVTGRLVAGPVSDQGELDAALAAADLVILDFELMPRDEHPDDDPGGPGRPL